MTGGPPSRISERVLRRVAREYRGRGLDEALYLLGEMDLRPWRIDDDPAGPERVHVAVLELARGNVQELLRAVVEAETDWRDVLVAAGLENDDWARRVDELLAEPDDPDDPDDPA
jgi:hypothetical protein